MYRYDIGLREKKSNIRLDFESLQANEQMSLLYSWLNTSN